MVEAVVRQHDGRMRRGEFQLLAGAGGVIDTNDYNTEDLPRCQDENQPFVPEIQGKFRFIGRKMPFF